jgi:hypothetical protein
VAYIGISTVTADNTPATGGYQLSAGKELEITTDSLDLHTGLYVRATGACGVSFVYFS